MHVAATLQAERSWQHGAERPPHYLCWAAYATPMACIMIAFWACMRFSASSKMIELAAAGEGRGLRIESVAEVQEAAAHCTV